MRGFYTKNTDISEREFRKETDEGSSGEFCKKSEQIYRRGRGEIPRRALRTALIETVFSQLTLPHIDRSRSTAGLVRRRAVRKLL